MASNRRPRIKALAYALIYLLLAGLWILLSGHALDYIVSVAEIRADLEVYKGLLFVVLTALALYALLRSWQGGMTEGEVAPASGSDLLFVLYLFGLLLVVALGGYVIFENLRQNETRKYEQNLSAIARLKAEQVNAWLKQNLDFVTAAGNRSYLAINFAQWARQGSLPRERELWLRHRMDTLQQSYPYGSIHLESLEGKVYLSTGFSDDFTVHHPGLAQRVARVKQPQTGEMHWCNDSAGSRSLCLPLLTPLMPTGTEGEVVGVLHFEIRADRFLFPLLQSWPTPSQSAETLMFYRVGDDIVYLNDLRHKEGMLLKSLAIKEYPKVLAVQAAEGRIGLLQGHDYRGIESIGYAVKVPGTDWLILSKMDADEIRLPIRRLAFNVALTAFLLAVIGSLTLYFWWRKRRVQYESAKIQAELQKKVLEKQVDFLSKHANDIILLFDEKGTIIDANDRAEEAYQYARSDLIGLGIRELRGGENPAMIDSQWGRVLSQGSLLFEGVHVRKDGSRFPVEVSSRRIDASRGVFVQSIVRDISERKQAQEALRASEERLSLLFNNMTNGFALHEVIRDAAGKVIDYRYIQVNPAYEKMTGLKRDEVVGRTVRQVLPDIEAYWIENFGEVAITGTPKYLENHVAGIGRWLSVYAYRPAPEQFAAVVQDISERKRVEQREQRLKNILRALSEINGAIMRLEDADALFPLVCRIAVEFGGMALAWVGAREASGNRIVPIASAGCAVGYLDSIMVESKGGTPEGEGPIGKTFREKRAKVVDDFQSDAMTAPWRQRAVEFGLRSSATFPIILRGDTCAVLAVYSDQTGAFDEEVVGLFEDMARGIGFALENFNREKLRREAESAMRQSEARFRRVADEAPFPSMLYADDGEVLLVNHAWTEITGYTRADIPNIATWTDKAYGNSALAVQTIIQGLFDIKRREDSGEFTIRCKDGSQRIWHFVSSPLGRLPDNRRMLISMAMDVTERKRAEEEMQQAAMVFDSSHGVIMITDSQSRFVAVNPAFTRITGYEEEEVLGLTPSILNSTRHNPEFYRELWSSLEQEGHWQGEIWNRRKNGEEYVSWLSVSALRDENGAVKQYIGIADDITEIKESQSRIEYLAYHDALTGLPNRTLASDRLRQAMARAQRLRSRVAVMFLDLDDFKTINDTLGHPVGDQMLKLVSERLRQCVRESDTVSRQGGDEFLVMLNDVTDLDAINNVAVDILGKVNRPYRIDDHELTISTSIGIAVYPDDGMDGDTLLKNADMAMYNAKQAGRNTHRFFAEEMNEYVLEHLLIRNGLIRALENDEFQLHYQPQLDLKTGQLVGGEALIRWQHPGLGMIPPNRFIQVAEETGMIVQIGSWVLQEACRQAKAWHLAGWSGLSVSVNISALQFRRGDLEQTISSALKDSGLAPQFLELELTESILIQDVGKSLDMIRRLKELGVKLSIDDFGTGYSSLAYLRQLPVDKLKIDQSFVREITSHQDDAAIALSIITLAHTLQKRVIAEGVETVEQLNFMREHGCDEIQGYLFCRPLSAEAFDDFLAQGGKQNFLEQVR